MHEFPFSWRFFYYSSILLYGVLTLWNKPWLWDIRYCWYHYPYHYLDRGVWWYYIVELSFYWSLIVSQVTNFYLRVLVHAISTKSFYFSSTM